MITKSNSICEELSKYLVLNEFSDYSFPGIYLVPTHIWVRGVTR